MNLSLSNMLSSSVSGLDPDAKGYIDAVVTAGATVSATQKKAINTFVKTGKSDGWYSSIKRLYLPIWAIAAPNAIDMIGLTSGTFNGTVTHSAGYVQGDGSTGYLNANSSPQTLGLTNSTGLLVALVKTAPTGIGISALMGSVTGGRTQLFANVDLIVSNQAEGATASYTGTRASNTGIYVSNRESNTSLSLYSRKAAGLVLHATNTNSATGTQSSALSLMAQGASIPSDGEFGLFAVGLGLAGASMEAFTLALKNLWETATGLTLEGAEYINTITAAGATVTATQEAAIHDFIRTGKSDGWWSSLKRLYLPIWASAAPNAVDMITRASGTFNGTVTHSAGYVQGDGSTGYFDTLSRFDTLGFTVETGYQFGLIYSGTLAVLAQIQGAGLAATAKQTVLGQAANAGRARLRHSGGGTGSIESITTVQGIISGSRTVGDRSLYKRGATRSVLISTSGGDSGTIPESNVYALAWNNSDDAGGANPSAFSNVEIGSYGFGLGFTNSQDSAFTLALKNLWETCTGLTLP